MILVNKDKILYFKTKNYRCSVGLNGFTKNKIEGDKKTPIGVYSFGKLFVRTDNIKNLNTMFKYIPIRKDMAWSDDSNKSNYNNLIKTKNKHKESLYRDDNLYDLILVINYNMKPIIKNRGSAIFLHLTKNFKPTAGCIAISCNNFLKLIKIINNKTKIKI